MLALSAAGQALGIVKDLQQIDRDISQSELRLKMAELYGNLADMRIALADAQLALRAKDDEISSLRSAAAKERNLVDVDGFKYDSVDGQPTGLPYCPTCEVNLGKFFRLSRGSEQFSTCANCKNTHNAGADGRVNEKRPPVNVVTRRRI